MRKRKYFKAKFKPVCGAVCSFLQALERFQPAGNWERDHVKIANSIADAEPFTLILFAEPLRAQHWRSSKYVEIHRVSRPSLRDEIVFKHFGAVLDCQMLEFLQKKSDPQDLHLRWLVRRYYPRAKGILKDRHPKIWKRLWHSGAWEKPRMRIDRQRRYFMPNPLGLGRTDVPQQFYFVNSSQTYSRGCSTTSYSRETHSYFGLAFLELSQRQRIPSYIFVYDRDNKLKFVSQIDRFVILPDSIGSNCDVDSRIVNCMLQDAWKIRAVRSSDYDRIKGLELFC